VTSYARTEVVRLLDLEEGFLESLEQESIVQVDAEERYSARMVERIRVAHSLVFDLEVNLSGVAVILRMREEIGSMQSLLDRVQRLLRERGLDEVIDQD
jgi:hypothetical protein